MSNKQILTASERAKGLIFDLDGTLLDSMPLHWQAWQSACRQYGCEVEYDYFIGLAGKSVETIAQILVVHYSINASAAQIVEAKKAMVNDYIDNVKEIKPVADIVRMNLGKLPMAVGTGSDRARAERMLRNVGMLDYFVGIVSADDVANSKPDPETFLKCAEIMGVAPEDCQVFEDAAPGLEAARRGGMIATDVRPYYE